MDLPLNHRCYDWQDFEKISATIDRGGMYNLANFIQTIGEELREAKELEWQLDDARQLIEKYEDDEHKAKNERDRLLDFIEKAKSEESLTKKDALNDIGKLLERMF